MISADGIALNKFINAAGGPKIANSILLTFGTDPNSLISSKNVIHAMQQEKLETTGYAVYAYASIEIIAKAIENANSTDGEILAHWLHHHEVDTVLGKKSWDTSGNINDGTFKVYTWKEASNLELVASQ